MLTAHQNKQTEPEEYFETETALLPDVISPSLLARANTLLEEASTPDAKSVGDAAKPAKGSNFNAKAGSIQEKECVDTVCHELRTSLNGIYGNVSIVESITGELEELLLTSHEKMLDPQLRDLLLQKIKMQKESVHIIDVCARHQKAIVDNVLNFSKLEAGKCELTLIEEDPKKVIKEVIAMLKPDITKKRIEVYLNLHYEDNIVNIDTDKIRQVLLNLINNAIKFTPEGGKLTITLSKPNITDNNTVLKFSVQDNGIGMTEVEKNRIFTPYLQANAQIATQYGGTGLGLSISKSLIELMGGKIEVDSHKGIGTTFSFSISCPAKVEMKKQPVSPVIFYDLKRSLSQKKRILIVEDNIVNQKIVKKYLEQVGYICDTANNGKEALALWMQNSFTLILMDCEMPVMDGFEATRLIREQESSRLDIQPSVIIGLSANMPTEELLEKITIAGMDDYLAKPFDRTKLLERITTLSYETRNFSKDKSVTMAPTKAVYHLNGV